MPSEDVAVLGIDAAWSAGRPSGVALLRRNAGRWECVRVAPSYQSFCSDAFDWNDPLVASEARIPLLLWKCKSALGAARLVAIAVDMPLASRPFRSRRPADNQVSRLFGHCHCSTHSPNAERPGALGERLRESLCRAGFALAVSPAAQPPALIEVYPHVSLLGLVGESRRVPYKIAKSRSYWPAASARERKTSILCRWSGILSRLQDCVGNVSIPLPGPERSAQFLKRYEDAIDALVCAWTAVQWLNRAAEPLGDECAAIWVPRASIAFARTRISI